jgi:sulfur carrier protein ThiS
MHRGSSKGPAAPAAAPETLPLSASPALVRLELEWVRAGHREVHVVEVPPVSTVRAALRAAGWAPEGCAVLDGETPIPLDLPVGTGRRLTVVPTFSGG